MAWANGFPSYLILFRAEAKYCGFPQIFAPRASALYSLVLDIASLINVAVNGAAKAKTIPNMATEPEFSRLDNPALNPLVPNICAKMLTNPARIEMADINRISPFSICDNSCPTTPLISSGVSFSSKPFVTATIDFSRFLPVAKAFKACELIIYNLGM